MRGEHGLEGVEGPQATVRNLRRVAGPALRAGKARPPGRQEPFPSQERRVRARILSRPAERKVEGPS